MNEAPRRRPIEILLVEDNPGDVRLMMEILKEGLTLSHLTVARDGDEALALLNREGIHSQTPRPDLIVLDLNLPKRDGRELLGEIKENASLRRIPVVVLTSSNAVQDLQKAYDLQANCYIIKPVGLERFMSVVQAIDSFWLNVVALPPGE